MRQLFSSLSLSLLAVLLPVVAAGCDMCPSPSSSAANPSSAGHDDAMPASTIPLAPLADYAVLSQEPGIPSQIRAAVRALPTAMVHAPGRCALSQGLRELAQSDPLHHGYAVELLPSRDWYHAHGGVGHYSVGSATRPDEMINGFATRVALEALGANTRALYFDFDSRNIPDGTRTEFAYKQYTSTMDVDVSRVALKGVYTQILVAPRIITTANASFFAGFVRYPLELPNVAVDNIATTVRLPSGAVADDSDGPSLSVRDPRMVFARYQEALAAIESAHPEVVMVYATVPVTLSGNYQRNAFNEAMRAWCRVHHQPLLDVASLVSVNQDGSLATDAQGPRLSPDLIDARDHGLNALARERLARAWWWMIARIAGWTPPA